MHTITIAGDERTARSISNYFMLAEAPRDAHFDPLAQIAHRSQYETISASSALRFLEGIRPSDLRIVIGCDYLRWHTGRPGYLTDLWDYVQRLQILGARVVFK